MSEVHHGRGVGWRGNAGTRHPSPEGPGTMTWSLRL